MYQYIKDETLPQRTHLAVTHLAMTAQHTTTVFCGFAHHVVTLLPCLGVACYLHLEGDNLLYVDFDTIGRKQNVGDITWCAEILVNQSI